MCVYLRERERERSDDIVRWEKYNVHSSIHPADGLCRLVFWVDAEDRDPRVERVRMDGRQRATVVSGGLVYTRPRALTIDFKDDM